MAGRDGDIRNAEPRLLISVTRRAKDGTYLGSSALAHPEDSGVAALDHAIQQLERYRDGIARDSYVDWHIQINIRPKS